MRRFDLLEFFAPLPLAAVALLAVNDQILKPTFHNEITGKLSDVAVCFMLPLLISALLGVLWRGHPLARLVFAAVATGVIFTALELSRPCQTSFIKLNLFVGAPFGIRRIVLTRDPTDLATLVMLPLAILYGRRRLSAEAHPSTRRSSA